MSYTHLDHKNYLQAKREREMAYREAGSMLKYFQDKITENHSFQYTLLMDCEEKITNLFWADAKMLVDYAHFGALLTLLLEQTRSEGLFGVFLGFNHFRETVIFGVVLL
jgi:hypothetical protein